MKKAMWTMAALLGLGVASYDAKADDLSGRVVQVSAGARDDWFTGSVLGRRKDDTYWIVFTTAAVTPVAANRVLTAAGANHGLNQAQIWFVNSGGSGSYLYYAQPNTWVSMMNSY